MELRLQRCECRADRSDLWITVPLGACRKAAGNPLCSTERQYMVAQPFPRSGDVSDLGMLLAVSFSDDRLKFSLHLFFGEVE